MVSPLFLDFKPRGEAELDSAITYLSLSFGSDYAEKFTAEVGRVLKETCLRIAEEIAEDGSPFDAPHDVASLRFAQPVYRLNVSLLKRRTRRSSTGLWYVFYALEDKAKIGRADTLAVVAVRHSAARPFFIEEDDESE